MLLGVVLVLLGIWVWSALVTELLAWHAVRLGERAPLSIFQTPPRVENDGPVALAFLGDVQRGVADVTRPLADALKERPTALLASSGDLAAHGEAPFYGTLLDAFEAAGIDTPMRVVPGNHDLQPRGVRDPTQGYTLFESKIGPAHWAVRAGPVLVVGVDNAVDVDERQLRWIRERLDAHGAGPWIAVCHRPPRDVDLPDAPVAYGLQPLVEILEARPPLLVVCGHKHEYLEREVGGVLYIVNAHGGDVHGLALDRGPFELLRVDVAADGTMVHEITRHERRPWPRVYFNQLAVRCWWSRRNPVGAVLAAPVGLPLTLVGLRAPL